MKLQTITTSGKAGKEVESAIFDRAGDAKIVAQAIRVYLSNQRSGTAKTKSRAEVNLTKKKWFKQKHTGNARHGAQSAPIFVGGGVAHGPRGNANWKLSMSKTMRSRALETALHVRAESDVISIIEGMESLTGKTKEVVGMLSALQLTRKAVLLVTDTVNEALLRATQNIENVLVVNAKDLNTYVVARAQSILITPEGLSALETRLETRSKKQESSSKEVASPATRRRGGKKTLSTEV